VTPKLYRYRVTFWTDRPGTRRSTTVEATDADNARTEAAAKNPDFLATVVAPRRLGPVEYTR